MHTTDFMFGAAAAAVGALVIAIIPSSEKIELKSVKTSIADYVGRTGNGEIICSFGGAKVSFAGKPLDKIDESVRPAVINGLKMGVCVAALPKAPEPAPN